MRFKILAVALLFAACFATKAVGEDLPTTIDDPSLLPDWLPSYPTSTGERTPSAPPVPKPPTDPALERLIGKFTEGDFPIAGWEDMGGGLLQDPVWFAQYRRSDGAQLVLVEWAMPRRAGAKHLTFQITDVLVTPPLHDNAALSFFCRTAQPNVTRKILAIVTADPDQEWWRDVQQAWAVDLDSGRIRSIPSSGIECSNEAWGE